MASITKFKAFSVGRVLQHNNRQQGDGVKHSNEDIKDDLTVYNYHFKFGTAEELDKRLENVFHLNSENNIVMCEAIVSLPKNVRSQDERKFFQSVYDFYCEDFGEQNILNAVVHKDEITPHIHIDFIPVVKEKVSFENRGKRVFEEWKERHPEIKDEEVERLCCKELITRTYLKMMHKRLSNYVEERLGYSAEILNGATANGNKSIMQLKSNSLEAEIKRQEKTRDFLEKDIREMVKLTQKYNIKDLGVKPLLERISDLERQKKILEGIITRNKYKFTNEDLDALRDKKQSAAKSSATNVFEGTLCSAKLPNDAIVIIEMYKDRKRPLPQQDLIDSDYELVRMARLVMTSTGNVTIKASRSSDITYVFIKTDNERQTIDVLLELERKIRELEELSNRVVYMDKIKTDKYDIARKIFEGLHMDMYYYTSVDDYDTEEEYDNDYEM